MDYSRFDISDFAADDHFVSWVIAPNEHSDFFWNQWRSEHPEKAKVLYEARLLVLLMHSRRLRLNDSRKEHLWNSIQQKAFTEDNLVTDPVNKKESKFWRTISITVMIALFAFVGAIYFISSPDQLTIQNPKGKKTILYLPDGTKVWLNAESRLTYPISFEGHLLREVELDGEAFFDVTENKDKPFVVRTSQLQVKVLGTSFNIKSYKDQGIIETTLVRGSVLIELNSDTPDNSLFLKENEQAIYSTELKQLSLRPVKADSATSWKEGKLIFLNKPFEEVEAELERWYGVNIILEDEGSKHCRFSTTIENEPINKILELFRVTSGITYEIQNNTIRIKGRLCNNKNSE